MSQKDAATPMLRQYLEIKSRYQSALLFFRLGDFYELFYEDAITGSRELGITLTARNRNTPNEVPMCGVPYHSAQNYIARLIRKGYKIAICEQTEAPSKGKKIVRREVTRVITPGTATDPQILEEKEPCFLASLSGSKNRWAATLIDAATGEFIALEREAQLDSFLEELLSFSPKELLCKKDHAALIRNYFAKSDSDLSLDFKDQQISSKNNINEAASVSENSKAPEAAPVSDSNPEAEDGKKAQIEEVEVPAKDTLQFPLTITEADDYFSDLRSSQNELAEFFKVENLDGFSLTDKNYAMIAAACCLRYIRQTQKTAAGHITSIRYLEPGSSLILDSVTISNLDLIPSSANNRKTLLEVIDECITSMGSRTLRSWIMRPLMEIDEIEKRLNAVEQLTNLEIRQKLRKRLRCVADLERLVGRISLGTANPRDLLSLSSALAAVPEIKSLISNTDSHLLHELGQKLKDFSPLQRLIDDSISPDAPISTSDGNIIKEGFDQRLDELRTLSRGGKQAIAKFEQEIRSQTGIQNLRVKYNNVFGYFIEVSKSQIPKIPDNFERKQTLANVERFTNNDLKLLEAKVLGAEVEAIQLENSLFNEILEKIRANSADLRILANSLASLDALAALSEVAVNQNYSRPKLHYQDELVIHSGRHPIVENSIGSRFISNDIYLNNSTDRILVITGANMGGKSTLLRQVALIQILAQAGSFVPADSATLPIVDRIWSRVGASDDLASGRSTFMVEMTETAAILHHATPRSLILLDEIGRGTSTFDGLSIAWAVAEYLHDSPAHCGKVLFATHYHELSELADHLSGAKNFHMAVRESGDSVVFLHKLVPGKASKSYGIAVAKLAGLPDKVTQRASEILARLEAYELAVFREQEKGAAASAAGKKMAAQFSLFAFANENIIKEIGQADIEKMSLQEKAEFLKSIKSRII